MTSRIEREAERDLAKVTKLADAKRAAKPPAAFVALDIQGFGTAEPPPKKYVVSGMLPHGHLALLGAHGGAGKSLLALTFCAHVACGRPWAGIDVVQGRAAFVSLEDPADVVLRRLCRIADTYRLDFGLIEENLLILDGTTGDGVLGTVADAFGSRAFTATAAFEELRDQVAGAALVVVDNASDAYDGNENDRRHVRAFMRLLAQLARENDASVLLLAHIDKLAARQGSNGNTYSGSTAWHNSARSRFALVDVDGVVELRHEKHQFGKLSDTTRLVWNADGVLVPSGATAAAATGRDDSDDASVTAALRAASASRVNVPTARTGPATAQHVLSTFSELSPELRDAFGRDRFWAAIARLTRQGIVSFETYRNENRKERERIVCAGSAPNEPAHVSPGTRAVAGCANAPVPPYPLCTGANKRTVHREGSRQFETGVEPAQTGANAEAEL